MSYFQGAAQIASVTGQFQATLWDEDRYCPPQYDCAYRMRGTGQRFAYPFAQLWPRSRGLSGDPSTPMYPIGQDSDSFEEVFDWETGSYRPWFLRGTVKDGSGNALAAANLNVYLTSTGAFIISGISDQNGNYELPTSNSAVNHFIVGNYANNTFVGSTVNTLQPVL